MDDNSTTITGSWQHYWAMNDNCAMVTCLWQHYLTMNDESTKTMGVDSHYNSMNNTVLWLILENYIKFHTEPNDVLTMKL